MAVRPRLRRLASLPPKQARARVARLRARLVVESDILLIDALDLLSRLLAARAWLRHDPTCSHRAPDGPGATQCTCGLTATLDPMREGQRDS